MISALIILRFGGVQFCGAVLEVDALLSTMTLKTKKSKREKYEKYKRTQFLIIILISKEAIVQLWGFKLHLINTLINYQLVYSESIVGKHENRKTYRSTLLMFIEKFVSLWKRLKSLEIENIVIFTFACQLYKLFCIPSIVLFLCLYTWFSYYHVSSFYKIHIKAHDI